MDFPCHTVTYVEDLLKPSLYLLLIQLVSVCLGKDSITNEWSCFIESMVINYQKSKWQQETKCTTPLKELREIVSEWGAFCPHPCPGDLWKEALRYGEEILKDEKGRWPNAVWLMGLHCGTHRGSTSQREIGWRLAFLSFVLATDLVPSFYGRPS